MNDYTHPENFVDDAHVFKTPATPAPSGTAREPDLEKWLKDLLLDGYPPEGEVFDYVGSAKTLKAILDTFANSARREEAEWWASADRPNGPLTLYPDERERLAALRESTEPQTSKGGE